ncbi:MAG: hypothetical protein Q9227_002550 [Pyrenula ochraceoflavens]
MRLTVYEHLLVRDDFPTARLRPGRMFSRRITEQRYPAILYCCRLTYQEGVTVLYGSNNVVISRRVFTGDVLGPTAIASMRTVTIDQECILDAKLTIQTGPFARCFYTYTTMKHLVISYRDGAFPPENFSGLSECSINTTALVAAIAVGLAKRANRGESTPKLEVIRNSDPMLHLTGSLGFATDEIDHRIKKTRQNLFMAMLSRLHTVPFRHPCIDHSDAKFLTTFTSAGWMFKKYKKRHDPDLRLHTKHEWVRVDSSYQNVPMK